MGRFRTLRYVAYNARLQFLGKISQWSVASRISMKCTYDSSYKALLG